MPYSSRPPPPPRDPVNLNHEGTFPIIKECIVRAREAQWPESEIELFVEHALAGDRTHMIRAIKGRFKVIE